MYIDMLFPLTLCVLWGLLGVVGAQNESATFSLKGRPTVELQFRGSRCYYFCGATKHLENPVENVPSRTTRENANVATSHSRSSAMPSVVTRPAMSSLARTVQKTNGTSFPEARLEVFGTLVPCGLRNTVQETVRMSQRKVDRQEIGSAQLQNQAQPRRVPSRPVYRPKPPSGSKPLKPKPKPKPKPNDGSSGSDFGGSNNFGGSDNNNNDNNETSNSSNGGDSTHWTNFPILVLGLAGLLVVLQVS
ncbi:probable serine/threonine-protein kinase samkC [Sphaerodactylus townsendi]|uniref:Uncharacterized protein n=1 Tax=Sphaerodactylus townsendi TaxID=933632 RepID=A0ACB8FSD5_9SAUR|nr:probable serine/threonine-protein kinase samkC [Sphaerodactylus townsendi]